MAEQTAADRQIQRAKELEFERSELNDRISANRDYLRMMDKNEELTPEQGQWLDTFYPVKEKGEQRTKEEVEATRKAKEAAKQEVKAARKAAAKEAAKPAAKEAAKPAAEAKPAAKEAAKPAAEAAA